MIKLEIDSVGYDLDDDLRSRIIDRIGGLDEFMDGLKEGHVAVSWEIRCRFLYNTRQGNTLVLCHFKLKML